MKMVTIPESDLRFMFYWVYLSMPVMLWFAFKIILFVGQLAEALVDGKK